MTEAEQRAAVVAEARSWLGTPHHHAAAIKGAGVDCGQLPIEVYSAVGLVPWIDTGAYPPDWNRHRDGDGEAAELYLNIMRKYAREVPVQTGPGDMILYKWGRRFAHGAIITGWPSIIHSQADVGVVPAEFNEGWLGSLDRKFFTLWGHP